MVTSLLLSLMSFMWEKWQNFCKDKIYEDIETDYRPRSDSIEIEVTLSNLKFIRVWI